MKPRVNVTELTIVTRDRRYITSIIYARKYYATVEINL